MPSASALIRAFPAKLVAKVTQSPAKPQSLLAGPDPAVVADLEIIRLGIAAQAAGAEIDDAEAYAAAAHRRGFGPVLEGFAVAALRSIGDLSTWPAEYSERLEQITAEETRWAQEYKRLDVALSAARIAHRAAVNARENLRAEDQQNRYVAAINPFLFGEAAEAAEHIATPSLTADEGAKLIGQQYQEWQIKTARETKLHYALQAETAAK